MRSVALSQVSRADSFTRSKEAAQTQRLWRCHRYGSKIAMAHQPDSLTFFLSYLKTRSYYPAFNLVQDFGSDFKWLFMHSFIVELFSVLLSLVYLCSTLVSPVGVFKSALWMKWYGLLNSVQQAKQIKTVQFSGEGIQTVLNYLALFA